MRACWAFLVLLVAMAACGNDSESAADGGNGDTFSVEFKTTAGDFVVDVTRSWSPNGAARFRELVAAEFYDGCRFFRVAPGFVVQFGINGDPVVNAMWSGNAIDDDPVVESNVRGYMTFAKSGPNSRTTQLFINYGDNSYLDSMGFSPFGEVRVGMDNVDLINDEYGEQPNQGQIASDGNAYLDTNFPNLDSITTARVLPSLQRNSRR